MKRIRYYLSRLAGLDYCNMLKVSRTVAREAKKPTIGILIDMIWCSLVYQAGYLDYQEFEFFLLTKAERQTWITGGKANSIVVKYNQREHRQKFIDKSIFNSLFSEHLGREWIDLRESTPEEFRQFVERRGQVMAKVTDSLMGQGIEKVISSDVIDYRAEYARLMTNRQYLIEEFIQQHPRMAALAPSSVNTLRMITFFDGTTVHVLEVVLKIGNGADVDNYGQGGMYTVLDARGRAPYPAFDKNSEIFTTHPLTSTPIVGFEVPLYDRVLETLDLAARVVPEIPYVGWDVAIGPDRVILIEGNYNTGVFQMKPSLTGVKSGLLPHFRTVIDF